MTQTSSTGSTADERLALERYLSPQEFAMTHTRHGLSLGLERTGNQFFLSLNAFGKLTHADYEKLTPLIDAALQQVKDPQIKALINIQQFEGWELRAAWDDFKLGLKHGNQFTKIAIMGNSKWQEYSAKVAGWFIAGEVKYFTAEQDALSWLLE